MKSGLLALSALLFACSENYAAAQLETSVRSAWYAGWRTDTLDTIPWTSYTRLSYAFALTTPNPATLTLDSDAHLKAFVEAAKTNNVKPMLSIGGWTGSRHFSTAVGSDANRTQFVQAVLNISKTYGLDGVDFDWEYPTKLGIGCNELNVADTENFLSFLKALRQDPGSQNLTITAAATKPWLDKTGNPLTDVSAFATVLDYVAIMNYDVWGSWGEFVGPNSPLNDTCASHQEGSAVSFVNQWVNANMTRDKIVLGIPSYGRSYRVDDKIAVLENGTLASFPPFDKSDPPAGDEWDSKPGEQDICGVLTTSPGGIIQSRGMIASGYLDKDGSPLTGSGSNLIYSFDNCSQTPFIYNQKDKIMISYDDPQSMSAKGAFIKDQQLRGFSMWEAAGDPGGILVGAVGKNL